MEVRASWRLATLPARTAGPALAAFLITGAGVAGVAQPIDARPAPAPLVVRPATIRIVLPPPAAMAPAPRQKPSARLGFASHPVEPATSADETAALVPAQPAAAPALSDLTPTTIAPENTPRPRTTPLRMAPPPEQLALSQKPGALQQTAAQGAAQPHDEPRALAASRGLSSAEYSAAQRSLSARSAPQPLPMVDAESRAALARMNGDDFAPSGAERMDALEPARPSARSLVEMAPSRAARPSSATPIRMQADGDESIGRYRRTSQGLAFEVATSVNGKSAGSVSLLIRDGENISVRLADLLAAVRPAIDPALYERLGSAQAAQSYLTFNELRAAGIAVRFNDKDRLILGTR